MKLAKIIFGVIVAIIISLVLIYKPAHAPTDTMPDETVSSDGDFCFGRDQVATPDAPYAVTEHIRLSINNNSVTGSKTGTQSGPDMTNGYTGTLTGTMDGNILRLLFDYTIEGSKNSEKEIYSLSGETLTKKRYVLKEDGGILVPDLSSVPTNIIYEKEMCDNN